MYDKRLPPLQTLLAFDAAARLGSFSRASVELSLTQSAITHQIHNLESWVGQPLFSRLGRGVTLTAAGELFSQTVRATLNTLRDGRARIEPYRNSDSVLIACPSDFAGGWLIPRLPILRNHRPKLEVWLLTQGELLQIDRIDVDLIISPKALQAPHTNSIQWLTDYAVAVCAPSLAKHLLPLSLPQVLQEAPLLIDEHYSEWAPWLAAQQVSTTRSVTLDSTSLRLSAAESGLGIAMISHLAASDALTQGRVVQLPQVPSFDLRNLWLSKSNLPPRTPAVEPVYEWLRSEECLSATAALTRS